MSQNRRPASWPNRVLLQKLDGATVTFAATAESTFAKPGEGIGLAQPSATGESGCSGNPAVTCALSAVWGVRVTVAGTSVFRNSSAVPSKGILSAQIGNAAVRTAPQSSKAGLKFISLLPG